MDGQKTYHILSFPGAHEKFDPDLKELGIFCNACKMEIKISAIMKLLQNISKQSTIIFSPSRKQLRVNLFMPENTLHARGSKLVILFGRQLCLYIWFLRYDRRSETVQAHD